MSHDIDLYIHIHISYKKQPPLAFNLNMQIIHIVLPLTSNIFMKAIHVIPH